MLLRRRSKRNNRFSAVRGGFAPRILAGTVFIALFAAATVVSPRAQEPAKSDRLFQRNLDEASRLLRRGNAEQARRIFEDLLRKKPDDPGAFVGYVESRIALYDLDGLAGKLGKRIAADSTDVESVLLLGDVRAAEGKSEEALEIYRSAVPLFADSTKGYGAVAARMGKQRMVLEAVDLLLAGRRATGSPNRYARDLASLYELLGNGEKASEECVRAVVTGTMKDGELFRKLKEMRDDGTIAAYPYEQLEAAIDTVPELRGVREVLAGFYLDDGMCDKALRIYDELDRQSRGCGSILIRFARTANGGKCYAAAAKALETVVERCDRPSTLIEARFLLASVYTNSGDAEGAAKVYGELISSTLNPGDLARARHDLAVVCLDNLGDPKRAIAVLGELLAMKEKTPYRLEGRFTLARAHIVSGDFDAAAEEYKAIEENAADDDTRERAIFGQGEADFHAGRIDDALADYRRVIDQYPAGRYLNDALERSIFLSEHRDVGDAPLKVYADCVLQVDRKEYDAARAKIAEMVDGLILSNLRNDFMWLLVRIEEEEGRYAAAVAAIDSMIDEYPMERLSEEADVKAADLLCGPLHNLEAGIARYEAFLVNHPKSILTGEVLRKKREAKRRYES